MNLKRIIALVLVLLFSVNVTASNVFAMKPQNSSNLGSNSLNGKVKTEVKFNTNNYINIKDVFKKILGFEKVDDEKNSKAKATLKKVLELFANEECYENQLPNKYREIMDEFSNTDFYTVKSKQDNFQSKFENVGMKISEIKNSISKLEQDFNTYKVELTVNKDKFNKSNGEKEYGASICNYCESFFAVKSIEMQLDKSNEDITKLQKQIENIQKDKNETYKILYSKYSENKGEIYSYIAKIIKTQGEKYDLQAEGWLNLIFQTQQTISNLKIKYVSPTIKENSAFLEENSGIKKTYNIVRELLYYQQRQRECQQAQKEFQQNQIELQQAQKEFQQNQIELQQAQKELQQHQIESQQKERELQKGQSNLQNAQIKLQKDQSNLQKEQNNLHIDRMKLQREQNKFQIDQSRLQNAQINLQKEQANFKKEQANFKKEQADFKKKQADFKKEKVDLIQKISDLTQKIANLTQENANLRKENQVEKSFIITFEEHTLNLQNKLLQANNEQLASAESESQTIPEINQKERETQTSLVSNLEKCNETENEFQTTPAPNLEDYNEAENELQTMPVQNLEKRNEIENESQTMPIQNPKECESLTASVQNLKDTNPTPGASINKLTTSPISKRKADPDIESQNLIDNKISKFFKDNGFAEYVYTYVLRKDEPFDPNYKLAQLDIHAIESQFAFSFVNCKNNINSLAGIERFTNISLLTCQYYQLDSIDLSKNTRLETLDLSQNKFKDNFLDLSKNLNLESLNCHNCEINKIILPNTETIITINLSNNKLSGELDLSPFKRLQNVNLSFNNLTGLTIADENDITELNISENENLGEFNFNILSKLIKLNCSNTNRKNLLINNLGYLKNLVFSNNQDLTEVDVSNCTKLEELICDNCSINELDLSTLTSLKFFNCSFNEIEHLEVKSDKLIQIAFAGNPVEAVYVPKKFRDEALDYDNRFTCESLNELVEITYK